MSRGREGVIGRRSIGRGDGVVYSRVQHRANRILHKVMKHFQSDGSSSSSDSSSASDDQGESARRGAAAAASPSSPPRSQRRPSGVGRIHQSSKERGGEGGEGGSGGRRVAAHVGLGESSPPKRRTASHRVETSFSRPGGGSSLPNSTTGTATTTATAAARTRSRPRGGSGSPDDSKMWADVASALVHEIVHPWQQAPRSSRPQVLDRERVIDSLNQGVMEPRSDHPIPDQHQPRLPSSDEWQSPPYVLPCDGDEPPEFTAGHPKVLPRQPSHQRVDRHQQPSSPTAESQATAASAAVDGDPEGAGHRDGSFPPYLAARPLGDEEAPHYKPLGLRGGLVSPPDTPNPEDMGAKLWNESWAPSLKHDGGGAADGGGMGGSVGGVSGASPKRSAWNGYALSGGFPGASPSPPRRPPCSASARFAAGKGDGADGGGGGGGGGGSGSSKSNSNSGSRRPQQQLDVGGAAEEGVGRLEVGLRGGGEWEESGRGAAAASASFTPPAPRRAPAPMRRGAQNIGGSGLPASTSRSARLAQRREAAKPARPDTGRGGLFIKVGRALGGGGEGGEGSDLSDGSEEEELREILHFNHSLLREAQEVRRQNGAVSPSKSVVIRGASSPPERSIAAGKGGREATLSTPTISGQHPATSASSHARDRGSGSPGGIGRARPRSSHATMGTPPRRPTSASPSPAANRQQRHCEESPWRRQQASTPVSTTVPTPKSSDFAKQRRSSASPPPNSLPRSPSKLSPAWMSQGLRSQPPYVMQSALTGSPTGI